MTRPTPRADDVLAGVFPGDDEAAVLARTTAWADTPLGDPSGWSPELCAALRTVMPSRVPMLLWWGEDLVQVYNEAYRPLLGAKHPVAMGQPAAACWPEVWDELGPMTDRVLREGVSTYDHDLFLVLDRHGYLEETYWTFSYSPVRAPDGTVLGVFVATTDVTAHRVDAYRLETVSRLARLGGSDYDDLDELVDVVVDVLGANRRAVPFAAVYLPDASGGLAQAARYGVGAGSAALPAAVPADSDHPLAVAARSRSQAQLSATQEELGSEAGSLGPMAPTAASLVPLGPGGRDLQGVLVLGLNPYRSVDDSYTTFVTLVARQLEALLTDVRAGAEERARTAAWARLDASKTAFFANVSHEFRTPLTVVLAAVGELSGSAPSTEQALHIDAVRRSAVRLNRLVDGLLDFARAEAGLLEADRRPVAVAQLTADVLSMFRSTVESAGLTFDTDLEDVGLVAVDAEAWTKVVANLVSNAFRFTERGRIRVRLGRVEDDVVLAVSDTGAGIAAAETTQVFERFHQAVGRPVRGATGAGIGLALVKDLVTAHGGTVHLDSTPGSGTVVMVRVPAVQADLPAGGGPSPDIAGVVGGVLDLSPRPRAAEVRVEPSAAKPRPRLLLVEDNPDVSTYLTRILRADGWSVTAVPDVPSALRLPEVPDLVLCDVMLPGPSGLDFVRLLRADAQWVPVPIVLLTARQGAREVAEGLTAGADDYVGKPFEAVELLARLRTHLELARERTAPAAQERERAANLEVALESNRLIGVAVGVLMAAHRVGSDQAFALLRKCSMDANRRLRDVAEDVVLTGELPVRKRARAGAPADGGSGHA